MSARYTTIAQAQIEGARLFTIRVDFKFLKVSGGQLHDPRHQLGCHALPAILSRNVESPDTARMRGGIVWIPIESTNTDNLPIDFRDEETLSRLVEFILARDTRQDPADKSFAGVLLGMGADQSNILESSRRPATVT